MFKKGMLVRYLYLIMGVFCTGMGIALARKSDLGISPVSSIPNVISLKFDFFTVGTWVMIWNFVMILIQVLILKKDFKLVQLLQFPISLLLGVFTDLGVMIVAGIPTDYYIVRILIILSSVVVLATGVVFMLTSNTIMNVGEALVNVIATKLNKNFGTIKVIFDLTLVSISVIVSFIIFKEIRGTREGTVITACLTGFVVKLLSKILKKPLEKLIPKG